MLLSYLFTLLSLAPAACLASSAAAPAREASFDHIFELVARDTAATAGISEIHPTYNAHINRTELEWVTQCLSQWCDEDEFVSGYQAGKVKCYTSSDRPQGGVVAYICNEQRPIRCSRYQIQEAMIALVKRSKFPTGWVWYEDGVKRRKFKTLYGFDVFCEGGQTCGEPSDPVVAACDMGGYGFQQSAFQYEREVDANSWQTGQNQKYHGTSWIDLPTAPPPSIGMAYPTIAA